MTINDYLDMEALDNILEQWAAATHMIAVVLDDEGNFLSNKLGFSRNNVEAFGESIEVDDVEVATVVGGPLDEDTDEEVVEAAGCRYPESLRGWLPQEEIRGSNRFFQ